ncbi:MAG: hypothetical protein LBJ25_07775 [Candidatus Margulisbacteria bacterium]|jgi:hypothetical protein|nr:hypothetical protein [Candidatus Margulisiibacteriota bacterium]
MANAYTDNYDGIATGQPLSAQKMTNALNTKENVVNKKDTLSSSSTEYPSAKAVYDSLNEKDSGAVHKAGAETITGVKTFGAADLVAEPKLGMAKTTDAANDGTKFATEAQVYAVKNAISSKQDGLPIGTILMYDGASWQDNITLKGWYSCDRGNYNKGLTPDLEDKFIKGKGSLANTGGSNALAAAMLPKHTHTIYTNATKTTDRTAAKSLTGHLPATDTPYSHAYYPYYEKATDGVFSLTNENNQWGPSGSDVDNARFVLDATHEHTGGANNDNSGTTDSNTSNMPAYYSLIYIRRCA